MDISQISFRTMMTRIARMAIIQKRASEYYDLSLLNNEHPYYPNPIELS